MRRTVRGRQSGRFTLAIPMVLWSLLTACTGDRPDSQREIDAPNWMIDAEAPTLSLTDGAAADLQFTNAKVRISKSGELVIGDMGTPSIRVYSVDGTFHRSLAQRGAGPGEINGAVALGVVGDTMFAIGQPPMSRPGVHLYSDSGFARSFRLTSAEVPSLQAKDRLTDGAWLVEHGRGFRILDDTQPIGTLRPDTVPMGIWHEAAAGASPSLYALPKVTHSWFLSFPAVDGRIPVALTVYPFAPTTVVQVSGAAVWKIDGGTGEVELFDSQAKPIRSFALPMRTQAFDDGEWAQRQLRERAKAKSARDSARATHLFDVGVRPPMQPLVVNAIAGVDGEMWVERFQLDETAPREFVVVSNTGAANGLVTLPRGFDLQQVGEDWVLGIQRDEDGIETILQLPLRRATR